MKSAILIAFAVGLVGAAAADTNVAPGDRVRITLLAREPASAVGKVLALPPDTLVVAVEPDSARRAFPRPDIRKLEISRGIHGHAASGALIGGLILGVPAAFVGAVAGATAHGEGSDATASSAGTTLGVLGFAVGAGIGALVGKSEKKERWEEIAP